MNASFDKKAITALLNDFNNATGLSIAIKDSFFNEIGRSDNNFNCFCKYIQSSPKGAKRCYDSDAELFRKCNLSGKPEIRICHAGLTDMAIPIIYNGNIVAYVILGQIKNNLDINEVLSRVSNLNLSEKTVAENYSSLQAITNEKITSIANIATLLIEHILFKNLIEPNFDIHTKNAVAYIDEHINEMIEIADICNAISVSKSALYKNFEKQFGMPPKRFINERKIEFAKRLLKNTDKSVENIALGLGFENVGYFYRLFKSITGETPLQYKYKV